MHERGDTAHTRAAVSCHWDVVGTAMLEHIGAINPLHAPVDACRQLLQIVASDAQTCSQVHRCRNGRACHGTTAVSHMAGPASCPVGGPGLLGHGIACQ